MIRNFEESIFALAFNQDETGILVGGEVDNISLNSTTTLEIIKGIENEEDVYAIKIDN